MGEAGYKYMGRQSRDQCFCGNSYGSQGTSSTCQSCTSENGPYGPWNNCVFSLQEEPTPSPTDSPTKESSLCAIENEKAIACGSKKGNEVCCPGLVCHRYQYWRCVDEENVHCSGANTLAQECGAWRTASPFCCEGLICAGKFCIETTDSPTDAPTDSPTDSLPADAVVSFKTADGRCLWYDTHGGMYKVIDKNACIRADPQTKYMFDSQTAQLKSYAGKFEGNCLLADGWFWPKLRSCNDSAQQKMELVGNKIKTTENNKCLTLFDNSNRFKFDDCVDGGNVEFTTVVQGMSTDSPTDAPIDSPTDSLPTDAVVSFKTTDGRCLWYDTHGGMYKVIDKNACIRADPQT